MFGAYESQDCWAVLRRFRQMDNATGFVTYDELRKLVGAEEFCLLFLWDLFSQSNEFLEVKTLLTVVCLFSNARMEERGRFLLTVFDEEQLSANTGEELAQLCLTILGALARCLATPAPRAKEVTSSLKHELPTMLPAYHEAVELVGADQAFKSERVIAHTDMERLLAPLRPVYERSPLSQAQLPGCQPPPLPSWGISADAPEATVTLRPQAGAPGGDVAAGAAASKPRFAQAEPHLAWMRKLEADDAQELAEGFGTPAAAPSTGRSARSWMLMHSTDFATVAQDLGSFKRLFVRSVSTSIGLPATCIEVVNVTNAPTVPGATLVEFQMHPPPYGGDARGASGLLLLLEEQLRSPYSALRKGQLAAYVERAELLTGEPKRASTPLHPASADDGVDRAEQACQTESALLLATPWSVKRPSPLRPLEEQEAEKAARLRTIMRTIEMARRRAAKAAAARPDALELLRRREAELAALREEEELAAAARREEEELAAAARRGEAEIAVA